MKTPDDIFPILLVYVDHFLGIPCTFLYNILAALIRSLGDSKTPVIFLALASVLNIGLDLVFIIVFRMASKELHWRLCWHRESPGCVVCGILESIFQSCGERKKSGNHCQSI